MFSTSVRRVARSTNAITSGCIAALTKTAPTCCIAHRRLSSTKTTAATEERNRKLKDQEEKLKLAGGNVLSSQARTTRTRKKARAVTLSESGSYPDVRVPSVPSTEHIPASHFNLASIFSQHRPLSITTPLPTATSEEAFNSIFEATVETKHDPGNVMFTLGAAVDRLDQAAQAAQSRQSGDVAWNVVQDAGNGEVTHLDGSSKQSFLSQFPPYTPPPPPTRYDVFQSQKLLQRQKRDSRKRQPQATQPKVWSTTVFVTEYTDDNGDKTWSTKTTAIVREPDVVPESTETDSAPRRQPFLHRMQARHIEILRAYKGGRMLAISVKRQRKLKMKKHKYKKLMKRTRNLRRRQDRN